MLDPGAFSQSLDSYLDSLSEDDLRAVVLRSIKRLDGAHRTQLALFLGRDVCVDPIDEVGGSSLNDRALRGSIESCGLLRQRFGAFLHDNPRAIQALGSSTAQRILPGEQRSGSSLLAALMRLPPKTAVLVGLVLIVAFVPLVAQYAQQRGLIAELSTIPVVPPIAKFASVAVARVHRLMPRTRSHALARNGRVQHSVSRSPERPRTLIAAYPIRARHVRAREVAFHRPPRRAHRVRIVRAWKFDPKYNPYFNRSRWRSARALAAVQRARDAQRARRLATGRARIAGQRIAALPRGFAGRARLMVKSYIAAVIAGDTRAALQHLGLPPGANAENLSELPIVSRGAHAHVTGQSLQPDGTQRVEVKIRGRGGDYFEVFTVAHDGPAVRIMNRYYVPVNRTAEERTARLLAKNEH